MESWLDSFIQRLINERVAKAVVGCTPSEIDEVERSQKTPLPPCYRLFLEKMGKRAGDFEAGSDFYYPLVLDNKDAAEELLARNQSKLILPPDAVVFWMHQGYQFAFLRVENGKCVAYHYNECREPDPDVFERSGTFEEVLAMELNGQLGMRRYVGLVGQFSLEIIRNLKPLIDALSGEHDATAIKREIDRHYSLCERVITKYGAHIYYQEDNFLVHQPETGCIHFNKSSGMYDDLVLFLASDKARMLDFMTEENELKLRPKFPSCLLSKLKQAFKSR